MSQLFGPSWRTTIAGIILAGLGVALLTFGRDDSAEAKGTAISLIVAGAGLCTAKDS